MNFLFIEKPIHNDRCLNSPLNRPPFLKRRAVISLVDQILRICSHHHVASELNYVKDVLLFLRVIKFIHSFIHSVMVKSVDRILKKVKQGNKQRKPLSLVILAIESKTFTALPFIPRLSDKLGKILNKHYLSVSLKMSQRLNLSCQS